MKVYYRILFCLSVVVLTAGCADHRDINEIIATLECDDKYSQYMNEDLGINIPIPSKFVLIENQVINDTVSYVLFEDNSDSLDYGSSMILIYRYKMNTEKSDSIRSSILNVRSEFNNYKLCSTGYIDLDKGLSPYTYLKYDNFDLTMLSILVMINSNDDCFYTFEGIVKEDENSEQKLNNIICSLKKLDIIQ